MTTTASIEPLLERLLGGEPLSADQRGALIASKDLLALGMAADELRRRRHGDRVTFVRVAMLDLERAVEPMWDGQPGEVRLAGVPRDLESAVAAVRAVTARAGGAAVTGFSLADLAAAAGDRAGLGRWCRALAGAGLAAVAWAPLDRLEAAAGSIGAALDAGLSVGAITVERRPAELLALFDGVTALVDRFPAVQVFTPLPQRVAGVSPSTGYEDVHLVALARLLTPVAHIQVDWQRYGPKLAQVALTFGADDVDGVSPADEVAEGRRRAPLEEIRRNIRAASAEPVERGALFVTR
jgi:2-iminoacetate synthase ThiH